MKYIALAIIIIFLVFAYKEAKKYDANNPDDSITKMLKLMSPLDRRSFLIDLNIACDDGIRCINLHGMDKEEIHNLAVEKKKINQSHARKNVI